MKGIFQQRAAPAIGLWLIAATALHAQTTTGLTWTGCADLQASDFRRVKLAITHPSSPTKMKIAEDGRMFFANVGGNVWSFDPKTSATTTLAHINVIGGGTAWGLVGMALDPGFMTNNWIFLMYSAK